MRILLCLFCALSALLAADSKLKVLVSVLPQKQMLERIGGEYVEVEVLVPSGKSPEIYEPSIAQMANIERARVFFGVGLGLESKWAQRFASINPKLAYYNLALESDNSTHAEDSKETHKPHAHNPHIWLSLESSKAQARFIAQTLSTLERAHSADFKHNLDSLLHDIESTQRAIAALFATTGARKSFLVYHPAFEPFAKEFGLEELSLEVDGKELKGRTLSALSAQVKQKQLSTLFYQPQFSRARVESMAQAFGVKLIALDPLRGDWLPSFRLYACQIAFDLQESKAQQCIAQYFERQL